MKASNVFRALAGTALALLSGLGAVASTSANYSLDPHALTGAGGPAQSANYGQFSVMAGFAIGTGTAGAYEARYGYHLRGATGVVGRLVFYNRSAWDGNNAAANASDDAAIAPDRAALLPGGSATFANYTSYSRGLNGLMVDLELAGVPTAADFAFKVGNNNSPAGWAAGPAPAVVAVRGNAGSNGTDRVTLIWADNAIQKQWLQVTVLASAATGLGVPDVFYFGNAPGESGLGNTTTRFTVTSADSLAALNNLLPVGATLTNPNDHNRDKRVTSPDALVAMNNLAVGPAALLKLNFSGGDGPMAVPADVEPVAAVPAAGFLEPPRAEAGRLSLLGWEGPAPAAVAYSADLAEGRWDPVPAEWLQPLGHGFFRLAPPADAAALFFRFSTPAAGPAD